MNPSLSEYADKAQAELVKQKEFRSFKTSVGRRFHDIQKSLEIMKPQVQEMHDFLTGQRAIDGYKKDNSNGSISISPKVWDIIKWLITVIVALVGAKVISQ